MGNSVEKEWLESMQVGISSLAVKKVKRGLELWRRIIKVSAGEEEEEGRGRKEERSEEEDRSGRAVEDGQVFVVWRKRDDVARE